MQKEYMKGNSFERSRGRDHTLAAIYLAAFSCCMIANRPAEAVEPKLASCGCYCGKTTAPPCSDDKCKQLCGWTGDASGGTTGGASAQDQLMLQGAAAVGSAIGDMIRGNPQEEARKKAEQEELARQAETLRRQKLAEKERRKQESYNRLSHSLKLSKEPLSTENAEERVPQPKAIEKYENSLGGLKLKTASHDLSQKSKPAQKSSCAGDEDFKLYQTREAERKSIIGKISEWTARNPALKTRADKCKLGIPLPPSPQSANYCEKRPAYENRMESWRRQCTIFEQVPPQSPSDKASKIKIDCLDAYDKTVEPCAPGAATCVNDAITLFLNCTRDNNTP